jgi:hypothetical protein
MKTVDYGALFNKLKKELIKFTHVSIEKKPKKDQQTYYLMNNQLQLLDVYSYKGYNVPPAFMSSMDTN